MEEALFFRQYDFHKKKLVLHRASMQYYRDELRKRGHTVHYIAAGSQLSAVANLIESLPGNIKEVHCAAVTDDWLQRRMQKAAAQKGIQLVTYRTPAFLNSMEEVADYFEKHSSYFQTDFYTWQRRQRQILVDANGKPAGGRWTFDADNRLKLPKGHKAPVVSLPANVKYVAPAAEYVDEYFPKNYGETGPPFYQQKGFYPVTHREADAWLEQFISNRFELFGAYEDAMSAGDPLLYHSCLTPMLNTGLLTPAQVLEKAMAGAAEYKIPMNSLEGFVRQVMGWREFIRIVYEREGRKQRTTNYWGFGRKIPASFWKGTTGIAPVDAVISKVLESAYCHHIERLMIMGNFMLLCEFDPDEVYRWFMELFIDAYDWVMVPNTYGMVSFADGGLMVTKPYISGSNYLMKMGAWKKGPWQDVWDALFWRFMHVHRDYMKRQPRLAMLLNTFDKMPKAKQHHHLSTADTFLEGL